MTKIQKNVKVMNSFLINLFLCPDNYRFNITKFPKKLLFNIFIISGLTRIG